MEQKTSDFLNQHQLITLRNALTDLLQDLSSIEKTTGMLLIDASKENQEQVIDFCHDVLQSLRLIPIYARNILKMLPEQADGDIQLPENVAILISGLIAAADESLSKPRGIVSPENIWEILGQLIKRPESHHLKIARQTSFIAMKAKKMQDSFHSIQQILNLT